MGLLAFGLLVIALAIGLTLVWVKNTLPWAKAEGARHAAGRVTGPRPRFPRNISEHPTTWEVFTLVSWRDRRLAAISQAGLVEKFVDALIWVFNAHGRTRRRARSRLGVASLSAGRGKARRGLRRRPGRAAAISRSELRLHHRGHLALLH
jgi:hypothetical protein